MLRPLCGALGPRDGPFAALATELVAAKALQDGDIEFARREFNFLRLAQNAPPGVVTRAQQALAALPPISAEVETTPVEDAADVPTEPVADDTTEETPE